MPCLRIEVDTREGAEDQRRVASCSCRMRALALCLSAGTVLFSALLLVKRRRRRRLSLLPDHDAPLAFSTCVTHRLETKSGLRYKLTVSLPLSYHSEASRHDRYPTIYVLDAEPCAAHSAWAHPLSIYSRRARVHLHVHSQS